MKRTILSIFAAALLLVSMTGALAATCGDEITTSGMHTLDEDLACSGNLTAAYPGKNYGLKISADNVELDCQGHAITNTDKTGWGILIDGTNSVTVTNCDLSGFEIGIMVGGSSFFTVDVMSHGNKIGLVSSAATNGNLRGTYNANDQIGVNIADGSDDNTIDLTANNNGLEGLYIASSEKCDVRGNFKENGAEGVQLSEAPTTTLNDVVANDNLRGLLIEESGSDETESVQVLGGTFSGNEKQGILIEESFAIVEGAHVSGNGNGIEATNSAVAITTTTVKDNTKNGIVLEEVDPIDNATTVLDDSTVCANGGIAQLQLINIDPLRVGNDLPATNNFCTETAAVARRWTAYVHYIVANGTDVPGATVKIYDLGVLLDTLTTNDEGRTPTIIVTQYLLDSDGVQTMTPVRGVASEASAGTASATNDVNVKDFEFLIKNFCGAKIASDTRLVGDVDCTGVTFTDDLTEPYAALELTAPDVTLDCAGYAIRGTTGTGWGILAVVDANNVLIKNCDVSGFKTGIEAYGGSGLIIENTSSHNNSKEGIVLGSTNNAALTNVTANDNNDTGIVVGGTASDDIFAATITNVIADGNGAHGLDANNLDNLNVLASEFSGNHLNGIQLRTITETTIMGTTLTENNETGLTIKASEVTTVVNTTFSRNRDGIRHKEGMETMLIVTNSTFDGNADAGIYCVDQRLKVSGTIFRNEEKGIFAESCNLPLPEVVEKAIVSTANTFTNNVHATHLRNTDIASFWEDYLTENTFSGNTLVLVEEWSVDLDVSFESGEPATAAYTARTTEGDVVGSGTTEDGAASLLVPTYLTAQGATALEQLTTVFHAETTVNGTVYGNTTSAAIAEKRTFALGNPYPLILTAGFADSDGDGVVDDTDNCVVTFNVDQADMNGDGIGDACDADGDGFLNTAAGGDDCDDANAAIHPGAREICGDGIDQDCSDSDKVCASNGGDNGGGHDCAIGYHREDGRCVRDVTVNSPPESKENEEDEAAENENDENTARGGGAGNRLANEASNEEENASSDLLTGAVTGAAKNAGKTWPYLAVFFGILGILVVAFLVERTIAGKKKVKK